MRKMENLTKINNMSCITFRPKQSTDSVAIQITNGTGCSAPVTISANLSNKKNIFVGWILVKLCWRSYRNINAFNKRNLYDKWNYST